MVIDALSAKLPRPSEPFRESIKTRERVDERIRGDQGMAISMELYDVELRLWALADMLRLSQCGVDSVESIARSHLPASANIREWMQDIGKAVDAINECLKLDEIYELGKHEIANDQSVHPKG